MSGILYVLATPIGNLGDLSPRAAEVLRTVALVAAEDTRETGKLVHHVGSSARLISVHAHSPRRRLDEVVGRLEAGDDVALATDAGTPGVSDPGPALVRLAREAGVRVVPIPGASAVHTALSASGFEADRYAFFGFPPRSGSARTAWLEGVAESPVTVVCFEAPGRVAALLADLAGGTGAERRAVVGRELTKKFEEIVAGTVAELAERVAAGEGRGEFTVVVEGAPPAPAAGDDALAERLARALRQADVGGSAAARVISEVTGLSRNQSYRLAMEDRS